MPFAKCLLFIFMPSAWHQIDYILGINPLGLSLMVGCGSKYPQFLHHRGASIVSFSTDPSQVGCQEGVQKWYQSPRPNPNVHNGAIVGGPDAVSSQCMALHMLLFHHESSLQPS